VSNNDTARELEKLRADVAALSDARGQDAAQPSEPPASSTEPVTEPAPIELAIPEEQKSQLEELGDLLQAEIRDLPTITCLAVFSLGILMGRLMR
jgi:hypothetical protein